MTYNFEDILKLRYVNINMKRVNIHNESLRDGWVLVFYARTCGIKHSSDHSLK